MHKTRHCRAGSSEEREHERSLHVTICGCWVGICLVLGCVFCACAYAYPFDAVLDALGFSPEGATLHVLRGKDRIQICARKLLQSFW